MPRGAGWIRVWLVAKRIKVQRFDDLAALVSDQPRAALAVFVSMQFAVQKVFDSDNKKALITDRETMFGYQDLVVDFRGIPTMRQFAPVVMDVTHSLQQPNQTTGVTGGRPDMIETIARAAIVNNSDGLFIETHFDPANAKSDGANMLLLDLLEGLLTRLVAIRKTINEF